MSADQSRTARRDGSDALADIVDRLEIEALVTEFAYRIDHGLSDRVAELFAPQGWYGREGGVRSVGRDAIRAAYARRSGESSRRLSRHLFSNLRIGFDGVDQASGISTLMLIAGDGAAPLPVNVTLVQDYFDQYVHIDGKWLFLSRETKRLFVGEDFREVLQLGAAPKTGTLNEDRPSAGRREDRFALAALAEQDEARIRELWGRSPLNLYRILGHQPAILRAWTEWNNELRHGCKLARALRELIFLRAAHRQGSAYEWAQHVVMARKAGLTEDLIEVTRTEALPAQLNGRERSILHATDEITDGHLSDESFGALLAFFSPGEMIEVIVTASHACMLARVIQAIGVTTVGEEPAQGRQGEN